MNTIRRLRHFIERRFGLCLALACAAGLFLPGIDRLPAHTAIALIAPIIYISCFKVRLQDVRALGWQGLAAFYAFRFLLFPVAAYALLYPLSPMLALTALFFFLLPSGLSMPAFAIAYGGNVALAMTLSVVTNLLLPVALPVMCLLVIGKGVDVDAGHMFFTLAVVVFLPALLFINTRRHAAIRALAEEHSKWLSMFLVLIVIAIVIAPQRAAIFAQPAAMVLYFILSALAYALAYAAGWLWPQAGRRERVSLSLASGANNPALGISLALLYFPPQVSLFMVAAEISWGLVLSGFGGWVRGVQKADAKY